VYRPLPAVVLIAQEVAVDVQDLLDEPSLQLTLAAGRKGLANAIVAAHVSELTRPSAWLQGGELLMTVGLLLPPDVAGCRAYVADCLRGGVSGLVLGLGEELPHHGAPPALVTAADEQGLPLLLLPDPIPFIAVTKWVFAQLADAQRREWQDAVAITRNLTAAAATSDSLDAVLEVWASALGGAAVVTDLRGDALASAGAGAEEVALRGRTALAAARPARGDVPTTVEDAHVQVLRLGAPTPQGLLFLERGGDARARHALAVLVSLLSLELAHRHAAGHPERRRRAHVVAQLLSSGLRPEQAPRLAAGVGLPPGPLRVVVVRALEQERPEDLATVLTSSLHQAVARPRTSTVELLVPDLDDLAAALERAAPGRAIGISALSRIGELNVSARQADSLAQVSAHLGRAVQAEEGGATQLLLQLGPPEVLTAYSDAVLAPLDRVDSRERGELLHTLEEWLRCNGAWEAAAASLSVHRNTVRNRMARIAALTGRPLEDAGQRMELWLALQARAAVLRAPLPVSRPPSPAPDGDPADPAGA
jgi:PucR family transcriptional regulator, purine catabolism regulatory protein